MQASYIQLARELDRAEKAEDTWVKINCARLMLNIRLALVPGVGADDADTPEAFIASLPRAAVGDVTPIGSAKSRR